MQSYPQGHWIEASQKIGSEMQEVSYRIFMYFGMGLSLAIEGV